MKNTPRQARLDAPDTLHRVMICGNYCHCQGSKKWEENFKKLKLSKSPLILYLLAKEKIVFLRD